jgi:hypothetical protein
MRDAGLLLRFDDRPGEAGIDDGGGSAGLPDE